MEHSGDIFYITKLCVFDCTSLLLTFAIQDTKDVCRKECWLLFEQGNITKQKENNMKITTSGKTDLFIMPWFSCSYLTISLV